MVTRLLLKLQSATKCLTQIRKLKKGAIPLCLFLSFQQVHKSPKSLLADFPEHLMARTGSCDYAWLQGRLVNQGTKLLDYDEPEPVTSPESGHITPHTLFLWVAITQGIFISFITITQLVLFQIIKQSMYSLKEKKNIKEMIQISLWEKR